jgi:transposase
MALADTHGRPVSIYVETAQKSENALTEALLEARFTKEAPQILIGDKGYDSRGLHEDLLQKGIHLVAPHLKTRAHPFQDGRRLRRLKWRYKIERLFAWLKNYRRLRIRWETKVENFLGFILAGCILILFKAYL